MAQSRRPSMFKNSGTPKQRMDALGKGLKDATLEAGLKAVKDQQPEDVTAKKMPNYLQITQNQLEKKGVIDLKPFFAKSAKRKTKEGGGWYLTVPIARKTRDMSRRMYDELRGKDIAPDSQQTVVSSYLYDRRRESAATELNYEPKSNSITKQKQGKNRHTYVAFRTVSDKSPANSWIINRDKVNEKDSSKTLIKNVDRLMRWKMKNGWR